MSHTTSPAPSSYWPMVIAASVILLITMGIRQSLGLFVAPLHQATAISIANISFALAVGQFMWGAAQPVFGVLADQYGPGRAIVAGGLLLALGMGLAPVLPGEWGLVVSLGLLAAAGAGAGSFSILMGAAAQRLPAEKRAFSSGFINAGGSFGQFVFAPFTQALISSFGWVQAMFSLAATALLTLPLAWPLRRTQAPVAHTPGDSGLREQLRVALRDPSYWCLHAGFFTCGFHIAFLVTHLPGAVSLCGLPESVSAASLALIGLANVAGSLGAGWLAQRYPMKWILFWMYASRAVLVLLYLFAPKTALTFYAFAIGLGVTWLATVPPTAGLVGKLFGTRYLATLFGLTLLSHQTGGFFGAWLGGLSLAYFGHYDWMWYADIVLALAAAVVNLPIREPAQLFPQVAKAGG